MTPGIASSMAELSSPLLPAHLLPPRALSHFGSAVSVSTALSRLFSQIHLSISLCASYQLHSFYLSLALPPLSSSQRSSSALVVSLFPSPCVSPSLPSLSFSSLFRPISFFLTFNLLLNNYLSSMTDRQRLVLQEKAEFHLTKSLYVHQVSFTTGIPAVRGIGNPALCALSSLQSSTATPHT